MREVTGQSVRQLVPLVGALGIPIALGITSGSIQLAILALSLTIALNTILLGVAFAAIVFTRKPQDAFHMLIVSNLSSDLALVSAISVAIWIGAEV
ncbi:hypothetical protein AEB_P0824 [Altererythrobacter sp. B11]|uniref:hypothetical protein n=1 Tax=Altererythrobacter sp. B11 TaxID=2060312 RepID=UPI000DC711F6|nr:hypothetical protein [Altererythrobacter sp. B11]BBC71692.1 hypothetical protein AEB_P0824 [Altererythrobacter sp. B11]